MGIMLLNTFCQVRSKWCAQMWHPVDRYIFLTDLFNNMADKMEELMHKNETWNEHGANHGHLRKYATARLAC